MPQIDSSQALTIFAGNLPTFFAVILAWMSSSGELSDIRAEIEACVCGFRAEMLIESRDTRKILCAEFRRVE